MREVARGMSSSSESQVWRWTSENAALPDSLLGGLSRKEMERAVKGRRRQGARAALGLRLLREILYSTLILQELELPQILQLSFLLLLRQDTGTDTNTSTAQAVAVLFCCRPHDELPLSH